MHDALCLTGVRCTALLPPKSMRNSNITWFILPPSARKYCQGNLRPACGSLRHTCSGRVKNNKVMSRAAGFY